MKSLLCFSFLPLIVSYHLVMCTKLVKKQHYLQYYTDWVIVISDVIFICLMCSRISNTHLSASGRRATSSSGDWQRKDIWCPFSDGRRREDMKCHHVIHTSSVSICWMRHSLSVHWLRIAVGMSVWRTLHRGLNWTRSVGCCCLF